MERVNGYFDAIVVGTGPGGATVARELAKRGKQVLMLEWGGSEPLDGSLRQAIEMMGIPGKSVLFTPQGLPVARGVTVGGSSIQYCATAWDPPFPMLQSHGISLEKEVAEARAELPIAPLPDRLLGPQTRRIMESAQDLGFGWQKIEKFIFQDKCRPDCVKCFLGCPHGAKWSARVFVQEAMDRGARLITRVRARRVLVEGGKAVGVVFTNRGKEYVASAETVIASAGGIGTPVLLRASGIRDAGDDFFFDPLIVVMGSVRHFNGTGEVPMATGMHVPEEGYMMTDLTMHRALYHAFTAQALRPDRLLGGKHTLSIMIKAKDELGGRLGDSGAVRKNLTKKDEQKLQRGFERAKKILEKAGAQNIFRTRCIAAHPGGTAKVDQVVDNNLRTKYENLFVCDCSVIPEAWGLPPTLTLVALGKRLVRHLASGS